MLENYWGLSRAEARASASRVELADTAPPVLWQPHTAAAMIPVNLAMCGATFASFVVSWCFATCPCISCRRCALVLP